MHLVSFISSHRDAILAAWEKDARSRILADHDIDIVQLRDHLGELLDSVARDLGAHRHAPVDSVDHGPTGTLNRVEAVAEMHGARRAQQGMTVKQVVSEFPILRSCVMRLWLQSRPPSYTTAADLDDVIRFDEAIDRALTESVGEFMDRLDRSRDTFLGILGHDLRDPLSTVIAGGKLLLESGLDQEQARDVLQRIVGTGERMNHLVADLLDAVRTQLGGQMPIQRRDADLGATIRNIANEFATARPDRKINLSLSGDARGYWDDRRVGQAVANLVTNA
ncbi:MAG TPA: sensor histidine kinase, partial [Gemmatimonadaceae bacterium]